MRPPFSYVLLAQQLLLPLVSFKENVSVTETKRPDGVHLEIRVHAQEIGRVVGKGRDVARALQSILDLAGRRRNERVTFDIREA